MIRRVMTDGGFFFGLLRRFAQVSTSVISDAVPEKYENNKINIRKRGKIGGGQSEIKK